MKRLTRPFFDRSTVIVAQELLGKVMTFQGQKGIITETEAYCGFNDPASHAAKGITPRTEIMFGDPGFVYVYLIYGMYHCLNIVTEKKGYPAAVLIRGVRLLNGTKKHLDGPGKLCRDLGITKSYNGVDLIKNTELNIFCDGYKPKYISTPRIGIKVGVDKKWRFLLNEPR